ncbi:MAG: AAA family ATPase [Bacteroidales bacterium]|nr:AAA family ATPase [Bacteroidales bacterium]
MTNHDYDIYGITKIPFVNPPEILYCNDLRKDINKRLQTFIEYRGFCLLTGIPGIGKSILLKEFCNSLHPKAYKTIYIPFAMFAETDMLCAICFQLGLKTSLMKSHMIQRIQERVQELQPVNIIFVFDEIQKIKHEALEIIRTLTNFDFDEKNYISVIFSGTQEFLNLLQFKQNEHLKQRISLFLSLKNLSRAETIEYIKYHLKDVGVYHDIFTDEALNLIYDLSDGIPRIINNFAKYAFAEAAFEKSKLIELKHVQIANENIQFTKKDL